MNDTRSDNLKAALEDLLDAYIGILRSNYSFLDPEKDQTVIDARAALAEYALNSTPANAAE